MKSSPWWNAIRLRWAAVVTLVATSVLVSGLATLLVDPKYDSTTEFYVTTPAGDSAIAASQGALASQQRAQSYARMATTKDVARSVLDMVGVDRDIDDLVASLTTDVTAQTAVFSVTVRDRDPQVARDLALGYTKVIPETVAKLEDPGNGGVAVAKVTVLSRPELPKKPAAPLMWLNLLAGGVLGLPIAVGWVIWRQRHDTVIRTREQAESVVGAPVIGVVPEMGGRSQDRGLDPRPGMQAHRKVRNVLRYLDVDADPRIWLVASAAPSEGKSTLVANLAVSLHEQGSSVLVVDADLHQPTQATLFGLDSQVGLAELLAHGAELADTVQVTAYDKVFALTAGRAHGAASQLVGSEAMGQALREAAKAFDFVLVDSPPVVPVADAQSLAEASDAVLLVVRDGVSLTQTVTEAVRILDRIKRRPLAAVFVSSDAELLADTAYYEGYR